MCYEYEYFLWNITYYLSRILRFWRVLPILRILRIVFTITADYCRLAKIIDDYQRLLTIKAITYDYWWLLSIRR